eukprot:4511940-Alexandrium_andersonii.AAC.1
MKGVGGSKPEMRGRGLARSHAAPADDISALDQLARPEAAAWARRTEPMLASSESVTPRARKRVLGPAR